MTEFPVGARVRVTYETTVMPGNFDSRHVLIKHPSDPVAWTYVRTEHVELIPEPLPTEPGLYVQAAAADMLSHGPNIYRLTADLVWRGFAGFMRPESEVRAAMPLVQLIPKNESDL